MTGLFFLLNIVPEMGVMELGLVFGPELARTTAATEAFVLIAAYVFRDLHYRRLEWRCDSEHAASRRAAERFGFVFEGIMRQAMWVKGRSSDTALYAMTDGDWAATAHHFAAWLQPDNFRPDGRQIASLRQPRG